MARVEIYTAMACPFCTRAIKLLSTKKIDFEQIDVTFSAATRQVMTSRANGQTSVPQVFINENHLGGCDDLFRFDQTGHLDKIISGLT